MGLRLEMTAVSDGNADAADADTACTLTQSNNPSGPPLPCKVGESVAIMAVEPSGPGLYDFTFSLRRRGGR